MTRAVDVRPVSPACARGSTARAVERAEIKMDAARCLTWRGELQRGGSDPSRESQPKKTLAASFRGDCTLLHVENSLKQIKEVALRSNR